MKWTERFVIMPKWSQYVSTKLNWILLVAIILGGTLRLLALGSVPSGFHYDETQSAYNGYIIGKHLKNIHGEFLPTNIDYHQDFRPAVNSYLTAPFTRFFGNTEIAARFPAVMLGILTIYLTYLLSFKLTKARVPSTLAAFLIAISPFHIIFSRASSDGIIDIAWSLLAIICLINFFQSNHKRWLVATYIFWVLGFFTYPISRFITPLIFVSLISTFCLLKRLSFKQVALASLTLLAFLIFPFAHSFLSSKAQARFDQVSTFSFPEVQRLITQINMEAGTKHIPAQLVRIYNNKMLGYAQDIGQRYLSFFSPQTVLFDTTKPLRYHVVGVGMITLWEYIGLLLLLFYLLNRKINKSLYFIIGILLIAPLPSAVTFEDFPNFHRAIYLIPFWQILSAFGLYQAYKMLRPQIRNKSFFVWAVVTIFFTSHFLFRYFFISPIHEPFYRNYELKELAYFLQANAHNYPIMGLSEKTGAYIYYLYFNKLDLFSLDYHKEGKYFQNDFRIRNLHFVKSDCLSLLDLLQGNYALIINYEGCSKYPFETKVHEFKRKDGSIALIAYTIDQGMFDKYKNDNALLIRCIHERKQFYNGRCESL